MKALIDDGGQKCADHNHVTPSTFNIVGPEFDVEQRVVQDRIDPRLSSNITQSLRPSRRQPLLAISSAVTWKSLARIERPRN
jgi:hypothetical protein